MHLFRRGSKRANPVGLPCSYGSVAAGRASAYQEDAEKKSEGGQQGAAPQKDPPPQLSAHELEGIDDYNE